MKIEVIYLHHGFDEGVGAEGESNGRWVRQWVEEAELWEIRCGGNQRPLVVLFRVVGAGGYEGVGAAIRSFRRLEDALKQSSSPTYVIAMGLGLGDEEVLSGERWEDQAAEMYRLGADEVHGLAMQERLLNARLVALEPMIAERHRQQQQMEHLEVAEALLGSWRYELASGQLWWSPQVHRIFGRDPGPAALSIEEQLAEIHPEDRQVYQDAVESCLHGIPFELECRTCPSTGKSRIVHCWGKPVHNERGQLVEMSGVVQDITERRRAEKSLKQHEEILSYISEFVPAALYQLRMDSQEHLWIDYFSLGSVANFGKFLPRFGTRFEPYLREYCEDAVYEALLASCRESARDQTAWSGEFRVPDDHGEIRWIVGRSVPTLLDDGSTVWRGVLTDITEQKYLENQLQMADRLSSIGTLAAGIAHEINNPLSFVMSNLEYTIEEIQQLSTCPEAAELALALQAGLEGAQRISVIVKGLMTFVRPNNLPDRAVRLRDVIQSTIRMTGSQFRYNTDLRLALESTAKVLGNEGQLGQLFMNLLLNALQAMPVDRDHGNVITLRLYDVGEKVCVEIEDNGMGFPESSYTRLFDPFYSTRPIGQGIGLGLYVCRNIVTAMGGELEFESVVGEGSRFRVYLHRA